MISITQNEQCFSLNQDAYYVSSPEDQIAVSFICNFYLQIYRVCMRPHVAADFSNLTSLAVNPDDIHSSASRFNVTMTAKNAYSQRSLNTESISVIFLYQEREQMESKVLFAIGTIIACLAVSMISLLDYELSRASKSQDDNEEQMERFNKKGSSSHSPHPSVLSRVKSNYKDFEDEDFQPSVDSSFVEPVLALDL